jgi:hypothetical protein
MVQLKCIAGGNDAELDKQEAQVLLSRLMEIPPEETKVEEKG